VASTVGQARVAERERAEPLGMQIASTDSAAMQNGYCINFYNSQGCMVSYMQPVTVCCPLSPDPQRQG